MLTKAWWLLALCGVLDAMHAAMNLLVLNPEGSLNFRRFALRDSVWDMGLLALAAGASALVRLHSQPREHCEAVLRRDGF